MVKHYIYNVDRETVLDEISQLQPLNYNQFRWWRRFDSPNTALHKYSSLLDKIKNGDYESRESHVEGTTPVFPILSNFLEYIDM